MRTSPLATSSTREAACSFCKRRLGGEYYFACVRCGASYCYIHMSRHGSGCCHREGASPLATEEVASSANV